MTIDKFIFHKGYIYLRRMMGAKYLSVMSGPLKGYLWEAQSNHQYIIGNYEVPSVAYFKEKQDPKNGIFYDLGANVGYMAMVAARYNEKVIAFEPMPENIKLFEENIKLNNIKNVFLHRAAVSNSDGVVEFTRSDNLSANTYINSTNEFVKDSSRFKVQCLQLDTFVIKEKNPIPTLIKIDVEGAEYDVLLGAEKVLRQYKPVIVLSTHEPFNTGVEDRCLSFLQNLGYAIRQSPEFVRTEGLKDFFCE